jgi:uroporphyrinogen decarboxylase
MNHLERWNRTIDRKGVDRLPRFYLGTTEFSSALQDHVGANLDEILYDRFDIDYRFQGAGCEGKSWEPPYIGPELANYDDGTFASIWGSRQKKVYHRDGRGAYVETVDYALGNATTLAEIENHRWPQADWFDYAAVVEPIRTWPDYPFMVGYFSLGWFAWEVRGMERCLEDFYLAPKIAEAVAQHITDFGYEYFCRLLEAVKSEVGKNVVCLHLADDWGTQEGLLLSPDIFDRFFARHYRRLIDLAHSRGLKVEFHSCGAARQLYPKFIEIGVDIMNPVQTSAKGMVPAEIKQEFGKHLAFSGAIDVQHLLPNASPTEVNVAVKRVLDDMGVGGAFFPGPAHNIQYGTPPENVVAMYAAMDEYFGTGR